MPLQTVDMLGHTTHVPSHHSWLFQTSPAPMSQNRLSSEMDPRFAFPLSWPRQAQTIGFVPLLPDVRPRTWLAQAPSLGLAGAGS